MVLALLPCSDAANQCYDVPETVSAPAHDHDKDSDDGCSPSCYCNCCSVSITSFDFKMPELKQPKMLFAAQTIRLKDCSFISRYDGNIWNPPKFTV
jgi:ferredoxin